jgi:hypothetical protein
VQAGGNTNSLERLLLGKPLLYQLYYWHFLARPVDAKLPFFGQGRVFNVIILHLCSSIKIALPASSIMVIAAMAMSAPPFGDTFTIIAAMTTSAITIDRIAYPLLSL